MSEIIENDRAKLFYLNNIINNYELPEFFEDFKNDIKTLYHIDSRLNEEISFIYIFLEKENNKEKEKEKNIEIKTEEDYNLMKKRIKVNQIKDKTILIEIEKNSNNLSRKIPETFEEKIQNVVERELKNAGERIRKYLSSNNKKYYPSSKVQVRTCDDCQEIIKGDIFKDVKNVEEKYYCEKCSFKRNDEPMFVIH